MKRKISENQLTRQEQVVLDEVSKLQIEKEISDGLCISPDTVNTHINNMKKKIKDVNGLSPRTKQELIAYKISTITGKSFDLKKIREYGIQVLLIMINVCSLIHKSKAYPIQEISYHAHDVKQKTTSNVRIVMYHDTYLIKET